jgi:homoserine dehydrogenase
MAAIKKGTNQRLRIAIAGFGTVGSAVARILVEQGAASLV